MITRKFHGSTTYSLPLLAPIIMAGLAGPAQAGLDQFLLTATSPTTIHPGESIDFSVSTLFSTDILRNEHYPAEGEPGPIFIGEQSWYHGGGVFESQYYSYGVAEIGSDAGHSLSSYVGGIGTWNFSLTFSTPGDFTVQAGGSYVVTDDYQSWYSYSERGCFFWICGAWETYSPWYSSSWSATWTFPAQYLSVQVVPEPAPWMPILAALPVIALRLKKRVPRIRLPAQDASTTRDFIGMWRQT